MCLLFGWNNIFKDVNCDLEDTFNDINNETMKKQRYFRYFF